MPAPITLGTITPPATPDDGDRYTLREHIGAVLLLRVLNVRTMPTANDPECPVADVHLVDLSDEAKPVHRDALLFGGAIADPLRSRIGEHMVVIVSQRSGKSGRPYVYLAPAEPDVIARAQSWLTANGDPFAPVVGTAGASSSASSWVDSTPTVREDAPPF